MEFEFDFPFEAFEASEEIIQSIMHEKSISHEKAYYIAYQEQWKWKRRALQLETRCLSAMIERLLPEFKCKFWKIIIEFVSTPEYLSPKNFTGVCVVQYPFHLDWYCKQTELNKLIYLTNCAENAILQIKKEVPNISDYFYPVFHKIKSSNYHNIWTWHEIIYSPQKTYSAYVQIVHTMKDVTAYAIIKHNNTENTQKIKIFSEIPDERAYAVYLGKLKFINETTLQLRNQSGDIIFTTKYN